MEKFPIELLQNVFIYLDQQDKVECMLVCHQWTRIVKSQCLLETVCFSTHNGFQSLEKQIQENPGLPLQTKRLLALFTIAPYRDLLVLFPNLQLIFLDNFYNKSKEYVLQQKDHPIKWLIQQSGCTTAKEVLSTFLCPNLKVIQVNIHNTSTMEGSFFSLLSNAPNLTYLSLKNALLTLQDVEQLHQNAPKLETVLFPFARISMTLTVVTDADIIAATTVTTFEITLIREGGTTSASPLLFYIRTKYPNLIHFGLEFECGTYKIDKESNQLLSESFEQLIYNIGHHLQSLNITLTAYSLGIFKVLDTIQCEINELNVGLEKRHHGSGPRLLQDLIKSDLVAYIHVLSLNNFFIQNFRWLRSLTSLQELCLSPLVHMSMQSEILANAPKVLVLDNLLNYCFETVHNLCLHHFNIHLNGNFTMGNMHSSITRLELIYSFIPLGLDLYISSCLPHLSYLVIVSSSIHGKSFSLPNHNLVEVIIAVPYQKTTLLLVTGGNISQWFRINYNYEDYCTYKKHFPVDNTIPFFKSLPATMAPVLPPNVLFNCASVQKFGFFMSHNHG